jgi:hypothetical protein
MPKPQVPMVSFWSEIISNAITISIIAFSINASLSVLFANKHKYKTSATQVKTLSNEFFTYNLLYILAILLRNFMLMERLIFFHHFFLVTQVLDLYQEVVF